MSKIAEVIFEISGRIETFVLIGGTSNGTPGIFVQIGTI